MEKPEKALKFPVAAFLSEQRLILSIFFQIKYSQLVYGYQNNLLNFWVAKRKLFKHCLPNKPCYTLAFVKI